MHILTKRLFEEETASKDVSISRPTKRVPWGIKVPNDENQTIYVWLDALCSYLTGSKKNWPADLHILGKDILRFHALLWPTILIAADLEPPKQLFVHSHWTVDHIKMSKSRKNVVDPFAESDILTSNGLRYFLLREAVPQSDANYSREKARKILNSELADTLGNLVNRCCAISVNLKQIRPLKPTKTDLINCTEEERNLCVLLEKLPHSVFKYYDDLEVRKVIDDVISVLHRTNACVEFAQPWKLAKDSSHEDRLLCVLGLALESVRICSILLRPIVPKICDIALARIGVLEEDRNWKDALEHPWDNEEGTFVGLDQNVKDVLFKRIYPPKDVKKVVKKEKSIRG